MHFKAMPLGLAVLFVVLGFTACVGAVGWLIDQSAERIDGRHERDGRCEDGRRT